MAIQQTHTFTSCTFEDLFEVVENQTLSVDDVTELESPHSTYFEVTA